MSTERDDLAKVLFTTDNRDAPDPDHEWEMTFRHNPPHAEAYCIMADAVTSAGYRKPRQVSSVEELDALIAEAVVRSDAGIIYERYADEDGPEFDYWLIPGEPRAQASSKIELPALVIFDPEPQP